MELRPAGMRNLFVPHPNRLARPRRSNSKSICRGNLKRIMIMTKPSRRDERDETRDESSNSRSRDGILHFLFLNRGTGSTHVPPTPPTLPAHRLPFRAAVEALPASVPTLTALLTWCTARPVLSCPVSSRLVSSSPHPHPATPSTFDPFQSVIREATYCLPTSSTACRCVCMYQTFVGGSYKGGKRHYCAEYITSPHTSLHFT